MNHEGGGKERRCEIEDRNGEEAGDHETGGENRCDAVVVVSAPPFVQKARLMKRSGMTRARMKSILAQQMPDKDKRRRADFVVLTGIGRAFSLRCINNIVRVAHRLHGRQWPPNGRRRRSSSKPRRKN